MNRRYRLITIQGDHSHVHSVVMAEDEVDEHLEAEALLHRMGGWTVTEGNRVLVCRKGNIERYVTVRESDAMNDDIVSV